MFEIYAHTAGKECGDESLSCLCDYVPVKVLRTDDKGHLVGEQG